MYDEPGPDEGQRVLVDRLWPRGLSKADAALDAHLPQVAPSTELRRWYGHDPVRFDEFRRRYHSELDASPAAEHLADLIERTRAGRVTLLTATRDLEHSHAEVLAERVRSALGEHD
nr:DUF488 family protein [Egibacter rhizosphaerae]